MLWDFLILQGDSLPIFTSISEEYYLALIIVYLSPFIHRYLSVGKDTPIKFSLDGWKIVFLVIAYIILKV